MLSGALARSRSGIVRALLLVTGLAFFKWLGLGLLSFLGYRHAAALYLNDESIEFRGERRFLGLPLGGTCHVLPLSAVRRVSLVGRSPVWAVIAALVFLAVTGVIATTLIVWGISGREPTWIAFGLLIIALGVLLDAGAYLLVRRDARRSLATLQVISLTDRLQLGRVPLDAAEEVLDKLRSKARGRWR